MVLWHKSVGSGANAVLYPVSLSDVLTAIFMLGRPGHWLATCRVCWSAGTLKLNLAQGTAYAITTMLNYVLIGVGTLTALSLMGMQWDKLQWLAAGLTVGIGFGLQEVVGNFVSGIIILFERPCGSVTPSPSVPSPAPSPRSASAPPPSPTSIARR